MSAMLGLHGLDAAFSLFIVWKGELEVRDKIRYE